jgi:hypothetical protein
MGQETKTATPETISSRNFNVKCAEVTVEGQAGVLGALVDSV